MKALILVLVFFFTAKPSWSDGIDVCECEGVESLSVSVRAILENLYSQQGEVPPIDLDEFNISLALQLSADTVQGCIGYLGRELDQERAIEQGISLPDFPAVRAIGADGELLQTRLTQYREAHLNGRIVVIRGEVDGEPRLFVLRRDSDGEMTVETFIPAIPPISPNFGVAMEAGPAPYSEQDVALPEPRVNWTVLGTETGLTVTAEATPDAGVDQLTITGRIQEQGETYEFGIDADARVNDRFEVGAGVTDRRAADGTSLGLDREVRLSYGDLEGDGAVTRARISDGAFTDPNYSLSFGNAGADGQQIRAIQGSLAVRRPEILQLPGQLNGETAPVASSGKGGAPVPTGEEGEEGLPDGTGSFYYGEVEGGLNGEVERLSFGLGENEGDNSRYLWLGRDFAGDGMSLAFGAGNEDRRFTFDIDESLYRGTTGSLLYVTTDGEPDGPERTLTFGYNYDERPRTGDPLHTLTFDAVTVDREEGVYANGDGRALEIAWQRSLTINSDRDVALTFGRATLETQTREVSGPDGTREEEVASRGTFYAGTIRVEDDGQTYGIDALISTHEETLLSEHERGILVSFTEGANGRAIFAEAFLFDSDGVAGTPCNEVRAEVRVQENLAPPERFHIPERYRPQEGRSISCYGSFNVINGQRSGTLGIEDVEIRPGGIRLHRSLEYYYSEHAEPHLRFELGGEIHFSGGQVIRH